MEVHLVCVVRPGHHDPLVGDRAAEGGAEAFHHSLSELHHALLGFRRGNHCRSSTAGVSSAIFLRSRFNSQANDQPLPPPKSSAIPAEMEKAFLSAIR